MNMYKNIASIAALIGDPTRTTILVSLADDRALTAGELSRITKVSPQTASSHLTKLMDGGLLTVQTQGRHRYYRLSSSSVAEIIEAIAKIAPPTPPRSLRESEQAKRLSFARTCYKHLAGKLGVAFTSALVERGYFQECEKTYLVADSGVQWFHDFGVKTDHKTPIPRHIDWTERRHHIGGPIAVGITRRLVEQDWITEGDVRRSIVITELGRMQFEQEFHINLWS